MSKYLGLLLMGLTFFSCKNNKKEGASPIDGETLFVKKNNKEIGINFENNLTDTPDFNVYKYRNYYNDG